MNASQCHSEHVCSLPFDPSLQLDWLKAYFAAAIAMVTDKKLMKCVYFIVDFLIWRFLSWFPNNSN